MAIGVGVVVPISSAAAGFVGEAIFAVFKYTTIIFATMAITALVYMVVRHIYDTTKTRDQGVPKVESTAPDVGDGGARPPAVLDRASVPTPAPQQLFDGQRDIGLFAR